MASATEVGDGKDRRTPPKSPLAADAKPFVPSSASPVKATAVAPGAAEDKEADAEKEQEEEEEAKRKESEEEGATDEGDDDDDREEAEEQPPAPVKTFPVFTDQQRSRPSMQVRRGCRWGGGRESQGERAKAADSGKHLGAASCQLCLIEREAL